MQFDKNPINLFLEKKKKLHSVKLHPKKKAYSENTTEGRPFKYQNTNINKTILPNSPTQAISSFLPSL